MKKEEFRRLKLKERYRLLKNDATYIDYRNNGSFICYLYDYSGYYVEAWKPIGFNLIQWIEVINKDEVIDSYLSGFELKGL